jgi:hypothetical protein
MRTSKPLLFLIASLIVTVGSLGVVATPAEAAVTKATTINCDSTSVDGTVYLFPSDVFQIDFVNCDDVTLYTDDGSNPEEFNVIPTIIQGSNPGRLTFSGDGTFTVSADVTSGPNQGEWLAAPYATYAYMAFQNDDNFVAFIEVEMVRRNVTNIAGATLLESPRFEFPEVISDANVIAREGEALEACLDFDDFGIVSAHPFVAKTFTATVAGEYTFRTISTTPISSLTNYIDNPDGSGAYTPIQENNFLLYTEFDQSNPASGFVECGSSVQQGGRYLDSGEVFAPTYFSLTVTLEPGTYTIVSARLAPMTVATWNAHAWWTPVEGQSVNAQIWGPPQISQQPSSTLAATGGVNYSPVAALLLIAGGVLLLLCRLRTVR